MARVADGGCRIVQKLAPNRKPGQATCRFLCNESNSQDEHHFEIGNCLFVKFNLDESFGIGEIRRSPDNERIRAHLRLSSDKDSAHGRVYLKNSRSKV